VRTLRSMTSRGHLPAQLHRAMAGNPSGASASGYGIRPARSPVRPRVASGRLTERGARERGRCDVDRHCATGALAVGLLTARGVVECAAFAPRRSAEIRRVREVDATIDRAARREPRDDHRRPARLRSMPRPARRVGQPSTARSRPRRSSCARRCRTCRRAAPRRSAAARAPSPARTPRRPEAARARPARRRCDHWARPTPPSRRQIARKRPGPPRRPKSLVPGSVGMRRLATRLGERAYGPRQRATVPSHGRRRPVCGEIHSDIAFDFS